MKQRDIAIGFVAIIVLLLLAVGVRQYLNRASETTTDQDPPQVLVPDADEPPLVDDTPGVTDVLRLDPDAPGLLYSGKAPVYVTIYSHNEDSWESKVNTRDKYEDYREGLVARADLIASYGIPWNWQSDLPVVEAMREYEDDPDLLSVTGGVNILRYLASKGASLDPHAHTNNYADIAYVISEMGATPSSVIGGTIVNVCGESPLGFYDLDSWHENISLQDDGAVHGVKYPEARWTPEVLSDPGMGGHWFDDWSSGVWRPGDQEDFFADDPLNDIVYVGEGYPHDSTIIGTEHASGAEVHNDRAEYIQELVRKIAAKELPTGTEDGDTFMYTASIHVRDTDIVREGGGEPVDTVEGLREVLDLLEPLRDSGAIVFVDFETAAETWRTEYGAVPWRVDLSTFSMYEAVEAQAETYCASVAPPTDGRPPGGRRAR